MMSLIPHWVGQPTQTETKMDHNRRATLKALAAAPLAATAGVSAAPALANAGAHTGAGNALVGPQVKGEPVTMEFLHFDDEVEHFRQTMRVLRSTEDNADIVFWYHHIAFVVPTDQKPQPVARFEGMEFTRHERVDEHAYLHHGHNLSYPRDLQTGAFSDTAINPVTGKQVKVPGFMPHTLGPTHLLTPQGVYWTGNPSPEPTTGYYMFHQDGAHVVMDWNREAPHYAPPNFMETSFARASATDFMDPSVSKLMTITNGSYVFPYPDWVEMDDRPGHMLITWSGFKLHSIDELPNEFRERVAEEMPHRLEIDRTAFEEWD